MIVYIVINNSKDRLRGYAEQYKIFTDGAKACEHAYACGFRSMFGQLNPSGLEIGVMNMMQCGSHDVSIMAVEVQE